MPTVRFIDTCVLCNLLPVPGRDQHRERIKRDFKVYLANRDTLIMPIASVIETGNHIAHVKDGNLRRTTATRFNEMLTALKSNKAPWVMNELSWDSSFLDSFLSGAGTGMTWVDHATSGLGAGDLSILAERDLYRQRSGMRDVRIWTDDTALRGYT